MAVLVATVAALTASGSASAHLGGEALIIVPLDHVMPGQPFDVIAADMGNDATVSFKMARDDIDVPLDNATAGPDGHFQTTLTLPATFPNGYAELIASATDGSQASTWVLVGERTSSTPPPPNQAAWWTDPSVLVLIVILVGAVGTLSWLLLRPKSKPVPQSASGRKSVSTKRSRRT